MWFNSDATRRTLPGLDIHEVFRDENVPSGTVDRCAWLSSARVVKCWVKSATSATLSLLPAVRPGTQETASDKLEEGGDDVIMALTTRATRAQWRIQREDLARASGPHKVRRSPIESQLDSMKSESLVIVDQNATVNTFRALYTPPVTPWEWVAKK